MPPLNAVVNISHYNRDPDFTAARQGGIVGVIHKATQGADGVDPTYAANHAQAQAAGLMWGAYHFATSRRRRRGTSSPWPAPIPAPSSPSTSSTIPPGRA